jgi:hypothetical protein
MLSCVNCKHEVSQGDAKLFAEVFVCGECFRIAESLMSRGERELRMLLTVLKESIRLNIIRGELQFSSIEQVQDVPKKDLVTHLADLASRVRANKESMCNSSSPTQILSKETTSPSAPRVKPKAT